jgi:hypothetical protein
MRGLGAGAITITQPDPCANLYIKAYGYQTGTHAPLDIIAWKLCEAGHKLETWAIDAWHWTWGELTKLWDWVESISAKAWAWVKQEFRALQNAVKKFLHCVDCIDPTAPASAKGNCTDCPKLPEWAWWLGVAAVVGGGVFLLHELSPAINNYSTRWRRSEARHHPH